IVILAQISASNPRNSAVLVYRVGQNQVGVIDIIATPPLGPRSVSVNEDGSRFLTGWTLMSPGPVLWADIPYATGDFRLGGHAWDTARNVIYADAPVAASESPVIHVMDTDNLTVRERIQIPQTLSGRTVISSDMNMVYAASEGGVVILPVGTLSGKARRVSALPEDLLFLGDACNRQVISQFVDIVDLSGGNVDFSLSRPSGTTGVRLSQTSGVTPARVRIDVDPSVFQNARGTTTIPLTITSAGAVNLPF